MSDFNSTLTQARLKELLHYDPETGVFTWRVSTSNRAPKNQPSGCKRPDGYLLTRIDGNLYRCHRLAWLYVTGRWPAFFIDHINGNKSDNRIANLREATRTENMQNLRKARSDSSTGLIGAQPKRRKWYAAIRVNGRWTRIGTFASPEAAHAAYLDEKRKLHPFGTL